MSSISLAGRIAVVMTLVMAGVIGLSIVLSEIIWRRTLYDEGLASCEAAASDLGQVIEDNLELGIPLSSMANTQQLIVRALRRNPSIAVVAVLDTKGDILFDTESLRIGEVAPAAWFSTAMPHRISSKRLNDGVIAGFQLTDRSTVAVGLVVVVYGTADIETRLTSSILQLTRTGVLLLLGVIVVTGIAATWITRDLRLWSEGLRSQIENAGTPDAPAAGNEAALPTLIRKATASLRRSEKDLMQLGTSDAHGT